MRDDNVASRDFGIFKDCETYKEFTNCIASVGMQLLELLDIYGYMDDSVSPGGKADFSLIDSSEVLLDTIRDYLVNDIFIQVKLISHLNTSSTAAFVGEALTEITNLRGSVSGATYETTCEKIKLAIGSITHFVVECIDYLHSLSYTDTYFASGKGKEELDIFNEIITDEVREFAKPFDTTYNEYYRIETTVDNSLGEEEFNEDNTGMFAAISAKDLNFMN